MVERNNNLILINFIYRTFKFIPRSWLKSWKAIVIKNIYEYVFHLQFINKLDDNGNWIEYIWIKISFMILN